MASIRFEKSDAVQERISGPATKEIDFDTTDGPWVQFTYDSIRTQDGAAIANYDSVNDLWVDNDGEVWSDIIVSFQQEVAAA